MTKKEEKPRLYLTVGNQTEADYVLKMIDINGISVVEPKMSADISTSHPGSSEWVFYTKIGGVDVSINVYSQDTFNYFVPLINKTVKRAQHEYSSYSRD